MGKTNNIIEINGQRYDTRSGVRVADQPSAKVAKPKKYAKSVDGFAAPAQSALAPKPATSITPTTKPTMNDVVRHPAKHAGKRTPEHSKTLMRHVVKKPGQPAKKLKAQSDIGRPAAIVKPKQSMQQLDVRRVKHAGQVTKSQAVSRFATQAAALKPVAAAQPAVQPFAPARPSTPRGPQKKPKTTADLLQQAIEHATSHEQQPLKKKSRNSKLHLAALGFGGLAGLAVIGIVASQNLDTVRLHVASARAGFSAHLPGYKPSGFSLGNLDYSSGTVAMNYISNSDQDRHFTVTEKASDWDSQALRDSFVVHQDKSYQAVQIGGQTFYRYNGNSVTWVNGGVWYQVQSKDALGDNQLMQLASSL